MFALDLDGTLAEIEPGVVRALEARLGMSLEERDRRVYEAFGVLSVIPEERHPSFWRAWEEVLKDPSVYMEAKPYPGAQEAAAWLDRKGLLAGYLTARPPGLEGASREWLGDWGFPPRPLVHDGGKRLLGMDLLGAYALVDDHPGSLAVAQAGRLVFLLDRPYNQGISGPILRLEGWESLVALLEGPFPLVGFPEGPELP